MDKPISEGVAESELVGKSEKSTSAISEKQTLPTKRVLSWATIQEFMDDAYLIQLPTNCTIVAREDTTLSDVAGELGIDKPKEIQLVGNVQNVVILVLGGQIVEGYARVALTPTKRKKMPTKPVNNESPKL